MMIRSACAVALIGLLPSVLQAQTRTCKTITLPDQNGTGQIGTIRVPANTVNPAVYPVAYFHPGAPNVSVGLEMWAHFIHTAGVPDPPKGFVHVHGYMSKSADNSDKKLFFPMTNHGPASDGEWRTLAMSTFLQQDEYFSVGIYNFWDRDVFVSLAMTLQECTTR